MEYHGKLFGKVGNKYFDTGKTSDDFDKLENPKKVELRPFEDLIKEIEIDGERFVPIEEIAKLATGYFQNKKYFKIVKSKSIKRKWFRISEKLGGGYIQDITITENYSIADSDNMSIKSVMYDENWKVFSESYYNKFQIVKNLIKWGFIKP
jgi:hypothetical protein